NHGYPYQGAETSLPLRPPVRPLVDPDAEGEVDPSMYPQPKEATHKIRGRHDLLERFFGGPLDQELLVVKSFYFFFYSAFGSLFPLMGVYFKQMGMNAAQGGFLIGCRPFVEFLSAPFWGTMADRLQMYAGEIPGNGDGKGNCNSKLPPKSKWRGSVQRQSQPIRSVEETKQER
ncbi:unnamed protein product, partial [Phaedon cochleariae]